MEKEDWLGRAYFRPWPQKVQKRQRSETNLPQLGQALPWGVVGVFGASIRGFGEGADGALDEDLEAGWDFD